MKIVSYFHPMRIFLLDDGNSISSVWDNVRQQSISAWK